MLKFSRFFISLALVTLGGCSTWQTTSTTTDHKHAAPVAGAHTNISNHPSHIALLLPLQGALSKAGGAIRDGFITAYHNSPAADHPKQIDIIDTTTMPNIQAAYNKAIQNHADFIIGPLARADVQALAQTNNIPVTTLTLNYLEPNQTAPALLYQFGLSPFDEARQAAALAWQNGSRKAIILAPEDSWGKNVASAFQDQWQALGGTVVTSVAFNNQPAKLSKQIRNALSFRQPADKKSMPDRRRDFDVFFLAATAQNARIIRPLLKFYYAGNVPVYATSLVYSGTPQPTLDSDLDGVTFCDAPWALNNKVDTNYYQQISLFWPLDFRRNLRLYALGVDTYTLTSQLAKLSNSPDATVAGATGTLSVNSQHRVVRALECAQFRQGVPVLLN